MENKIFKLVGKSEKSVIPYEVRKRLNIKKNSVVSYEFKGERTVILRNETVCQRLRRDFDYAD